MTDPAVTALPRAASGPAPVVVEALLVGRVAPLGAGVLSAIDKHRVDRPLALGASGLQGDEQADRRHHGGVDKALHHVAAEHYAWWAAALPGVDARRWVPGAFGENLSTCGMTEHEVCVGDRYALGGAQVEVSQARQPCWKLNLRFGVADMARRVQASQRTGWYYRVRREGVVAAGDTLRLLERPCPRWPLARLLHHLYVDPLDRVALAEIAALEPLAASWRQLARRRLESGRVEDWARRLDG